MSLLSKINLRKILVLFLVQATLFLGLNLLPITHNTVSAAVLQGGGTSLPNEKLMDETDYELIKAKRRELQAERSDRADKRTGDETVQEKLNLDKLVSDNN